jgi:hypothetical protein
MTRFLILFAALALTGAAQAQGFNNAEVTCYNWQGGNFSAGSFSKCHTDVMVAQAKAPLPPPVVASPVMMPQSAPISCAPPPTHIVKRKPKPKPVCK